MFFRIPATIKGMASYNIYDFKIVDILCAIPMQLTTNLKMAIDDSDQKKSEKDQVAFNFLNFLFLDNSTKLSFSLRKTENSLSLNLCNLTSQKV